MIRYLCILPLLVAAITQLKAQVPAYTWAQRAGGAGADEGRAVTVDASGNVYTTGYFSGSVDFDPGVGVLNLVSSGGLDVFVQKLDASGNLVWAKSFGGTNSDFSFGIAVDASGNVYTTGYYVGTSDFDPGVANFPLTSAGSADIFVHKLNAAGNFVWAKSMGGVSYDYASAITVDASGNVYSIGQYEGTADFDPGPGVSNLAAAGYNDVYIQKLDASGSLIWAKSMGGLSYDYGNSIAVDAAGNVYSTGYFYGPADFDPGPGVQNLSAGGQYDIFVQKLNASGNLSWAQSVGGSGSDFGFGITLDTAAAKVYVTGGYQGFVDFDAGGGVAGSTAAGLSDVFIQKLNMNNGSFVWARSMGGSGNDYGLSLSVDVAGNLYTAGYFQNTADFDPGAGALNLVSAGLYDVFTHKLNAGGNLLWAKNTGSTGDDFANGIKVDHSGQVYVTGLFNGTVDFDPGPGAANLVSGGVGDIFVLKWAGCAATSSTINATACYSYTHNNQTYTQSGTYVQSYSNVAGCDSSVTLNLVINDSTSSTVTATACYSYTLNNQVYTQSGSYSQVLVNAAGCDSLLTLNLVINDSSSAIVTASACNSYALNNQVYTQSGSYSQVLTNAAGCDSLLTLNLTILDSSSATLNATACYNYTLNNQTYNLSGTYTQLLTNAAGCDSLITLNLVINDSTVSSLVQAACYSYTLNNQTYTSSGNYTQLLTNAAGCDSIIKLALTINTVDTSVTRNGITLTANAAGATYLWMECTNGPMAMETAQTFMATFTGYYAVIVTENGCTDTSSCYFIDLTGIQERSMLAGISVFPNPSSGKFTVKADRVYERLQLEVYDVYGKSVLRKDVYNASVADFDLLAPPGVYFVSLRGPAGTAMLKLVKE